MTDKQWEEKYWERRLRVAYFKQYRGILSEKTISDSADWLIDFVKPVISQEVKKQKIEMLQDMRGVMGKYKCSDGFDKKLFDLIEVEIKEIRKDFPKE